jgi:dephospho-CoA kinase
MLIGLTGTIGAGKGTVVSYFEQKGYRHLSVSGFLAEEARRRGLSPARKTLRELGNEFRAKGSSALVEAVLADANPAKEDIVLESLHTVPEVEYIRGLGGKVIAVDAPLETRWRRIQSRNGEKDASYETFLAEEKRQGASPDPDENNLRASIEVADWRLQNAGSEGELFEKLDGIVGEL